MTLLLYLLLLVGTVVFSVGSFGLLGLRPIRGYVVLVGAIIIALAAGLLTLDTNPSTQAVVLAGMALLFVAVVAAFPAAVRKEARGAAVFGILLALSLGLTASVYDNAGAVLRGVLVALVVCLTVAFVTSGLIGTYHSLSNLRRGRG